ncbi:molybdopterin-dependent oxidoreductase [Dongia deserti]|uniref:molybdopterin-dependent oxidoreductase n=1 Tax=Dongia deserti TaxID=2268030 RepID=UPI0025484AD7|nr:molybdopterin-dependent oxidoreductase [Dongia deserti]
MQFMSRIVAAFALIFSLSSWQADADSGALPPPQGTPILTMTGAIAKTNADAGAQFDAAMIAALPRHAITTGTPWYDEPRTFEGPLLRDVLAAVGASGKTLTVAALNDYASDVPFSDALTYDVVIADRIDGQPIPIRDRGPLFIIYPFDQVPALKSEQYYQRSVWQVKSIKVQP